MKKVALYIADMDEAFVSRIRSAFNRQDAIEVVGSCSDGNRALKDIIRLAPDVLLTDISLPGLDGFALLREGRKLSKPPEVIVCTEFYSGACMECARRCGASFFLCKPIEPESLSALVLECGRNRPAIPMDGESRHRQTAAAHALLKRIGMPARLAGSAYVVEAVSHCRGDAALMKNLSRGLYAELAERMDTTVPRIERSLRNAIAVAYERGALREVFTCRPSNKEFIEYIMKAVDDV